MKPVSLADMTYEQGLQALYMRKQALDAGTARRMTLDERCNTFRLQVVGEKVAFDWSTLGTDAQAALKNVKESLKGGYQSVRDSVSTKGLSGIKDDVVKGYQDFSKNNPELAKTLLYTGTGASVGTLAGAIAPDKKHRKRNMAMGAFAGGMLGGGLGLASNSKGIADKAVDSLDLPPDITTPSAKPSTPAETSAAPISATEMAHLERNRLPIGSQANLENVAPWALNSAGLYGATHIRRKALQSVLAKPYVDSDKLEGAISGVLMNPPKNKGGTANPWHTYNLRELFRTPSGKAPPLPGYVDTGPDSLNDYLNQLSLEQRSKLFKQHGIVPDHRGGNVLLQGRLQRAFGNETAKSIIEEATEQTPRFSRVASGGAGRVRAALALISLIAPGIAQAYFGKNLANTGIDQLSNEMKWQMLKDRLNQTQNQQ